MDEDLCRSVVKSLTDEQKEACHRAGSLVVDACPGSGKTRTVGARLALRMACWTGRRAGVAALSFTNVACREIGEEVAEHGFIVPPHWPHFLGTIDSFINHFVFMPFGHVVMKCGRRPEVVHPDSHLFGWVEGHMTRAGFKTCYENGCKPTSFVFQADGSLRYAKRGQRPPGCFSPESPHCAALKGIMVHAGYALPADAMYWAMKVLDSRYLAQAIATRFPQIMIDEAQDTSETQVRIIKSLAGEGCEVVLVGDPDQAIFEFSGARPDLFREFQTMWPTVRLSVNFRSSQLICNASQVFSRRSCGPPRAGGLDRDCAIRPLVVRYAPQDVGDALVQQFKQLLLQHGIDPSLAAVLARTHKLVSLLSGQHVLAWPRGLKQAVKALAIAATLRDNGSLADAHKYAMAALLKACFDRGSYGPGYEAIQSIGFRKWLRGSWALLAGLPSTGEPLCTWTSTAAEQVKALVRDRGWPCIDGFAYRLGQCRGDRDNHPVSAFSSAQRSSDGLTLKVIHDAKGETHDAVMVVCGQGGARRRDDLEQWLVPDDSDGDDEQRVAYVAVTRPRKLLVLAVPQDTPQELLRKLLPCFEIHGDTPWDITGLPDVKPEHSIIPAAP